ncbi:MAG TPA: BON domain-containing protein, partial [Pirellulaceae bacterium]|nr:BON domain-containing protein [Pirellulaceae bacterium]
SDIQTIRPESITPEIEDTRRQPFVGPNRGNIQHPYSNQAAGQQGAGQRQAGGTGARGLQQGGAFGGQFGGMAGGFQQGGGLGANNTVIRRSVRTRLQNQITVANADQRDLIAQQRVQGRMFSESLINLSGSVSISVENKRATLTGSVDSPEERQLIERMARMEPGIYAIDNQIQVNGQEAVSLPASAAASR